MTPIVRPRFSVVMPTRQRHDTLYHAMRTVLMQDHDSFELVVIDNMSSPETAEVVHGFQDARVRYVRTEQRLAMSDNWEFGLSHAAGEYVTVLGDDDGLVPGALREAERIFEATGLSVLGWNRPHYFWPNARSEWLRDRFYMNLSNRVAIIDAQDVLQRFYAYATNFNELPMIYNAFIHRSVIEAVKARNGRYFKDTIPDVYSGIVNAFVAGRYAYHTQGLGIAGVSGHSTGSSFSGGQGEGSSADRFVEEHRHSELSVAPHPSLVDSRNLDILVAQTMLRAQEQFFPHDEAIRLEVGGLLRTMCLKLTEEPAAYEESVRAILALAEKYGVGLTADMLPPRAASAPVAPVGVAGATLWVDAKPLAIANVYEAAQAIGVIRQFQGAVAPAEPLPAPAPASPQDVACSIVMVLGDHLAATQRCLQSLAEHTDGPTFELVVIDNGTTDGTAEWLQALEGDVVVQRNPHPVPEALARNQGAAMARGRHLVFLSPEAVPLDGWLDGLVAEAEAHPEAAIVGALLFSVADGRVLHAGVAASDEGFSIIGQGLAVDDPAVASPAEREMVAGACMLVKRDDFVRWGGFEPDDELEDLMLCMKARQAGRKVRYTPAARLWMDVAEPATAPAPPRAPGALADVLYVGPVYDPSGYADEVRNFVLGLERHGVPVGLRPLGRHSEKYQAQLAPAVRRQLDQSLQTSVVPEDFISVIHFLGGAFQRMPQAGYRIGRTMFETDGLPAEWVRRCNLMDEIWVPSDFNVETFRAAGVTTRLVKMPGGVDADRFRPGLTPRPIPGARGKVFLSVFEWSFRKGWDVLLQAWVRAFGPQDDVSLVLRTYPMNQTEDAPDMDAWVTRFLREGLGLERHQVAPIVILKDQIPDAEMPALFAAASAYVAPSRGEGWGRPQMEAMACGLPVIATRWSGNLEFMTDENSLLIDLDGLSRTDALSEVPLYHGQKWAEPSIAHMAALMRRVLDEPAAMAELGRRARRDVERYWTWERVSGLAAARLAEIRAAIADRPPLLPPVAAEAPGVVWEGAELSVHSFAHVNREVVRRLIASGRVEVSAVTKDIAEFKPDAGLLAVERCINRALTRSRAVTVRHQWPPDFTPPAEGAWVMMQPWEFGGLPDEWVAGMKDAVDEMWVYTDWLRDCYVQSGLPADRVHVVPLGVDTERFRPEGPRYPLKTRKRFKFLFLGGTIPRKGIDALLEAYVGTFTADDDVCLVIKGIGAETFYSNSSPLNGVIRQLMDNEGTDSRLPAVEFLDAAMSDDEVASIYRACDALVHPYRGEGFGLPMAEAMASGLPVVVTGAGAAMDFCDETNAYLIPATNVPIAQHELGYTSTGYWWAEPDREALGRLMREVVADPETARAKGRAGRARIERDFRWETVAETVLERLEALARRVPVRFQPPRPFRPGLAPWPLDAHRRTVFFHQPDWASGAWREVVTSYARSLGPDADATLVLWLDPASGMTAEQAAEALMGALAAAGLDPEAMPDVLLVPEALDADELARLYTAADWVVSAGDARQAERAALVGRPVLPSLSEEAWRGAIASASPAV